MRFEIRHATEQDLPAIVSIYNAAIPGRLATADTSEVTIESRKAWFQEHSPEVRPLWVHLQKQQVTGWISLNTFYDRPAYQKTVEVSLYVHPAYQRQGIGKRLLSRMIEQAPSFQVTTLVGFVFAHNQPSLRLFQSFKFQEWGYCPGIAELDGQPKDLVILGRRV